MNNQTMTNSDVNASTTDNLQQQQRNIRRHNDTTNHPWVQSIVQEYLHSRGDAKGGHATPKRWRFSSPKDTNNYEDGEEEDLVLAACAVLEEDDRLARDLNKKEEQSSAAAQQRQELLHVGRIAIMAGGIAGCVMMGGGPALALMAAGGATWTAATGNTEPLEHVLGSVSPSRACESCMVSRPAAVHEDKDCMPEQ